MALVVETPDALEAWVDKEIAVTDWLRVTQEHIQRFAESTGDRQWIHTDVERAQRESPFGATVAHGFLTLSLLGQFLQQALEIQGARMALNYGLNRVRFPSPVRANSMVRARFTLQAMKKLAGSTEVVFAVAVEEQGTNKPCCAAEWVVRYYA